jgi:hypothetical protein
MITTLRGKIFDENNKTIPSATVFLSDDKGRLVNEKARVKTDLDGNYALPFSVPMPNLSTGKFNYLPIAKYITVSFTGFPTKTVILPEFLFDPTKFGNGNFDITMTIKELTTPEVVITANRSKFLCEKDGGTWDENTKTCKLPSKTWWSKYKWWVIGGLALVATTITIVAVSKSKKNK